jgi:peptide/nickel transport system permease protein
MAVTETAVTDTSTTLRAPATTLPPIEQPWRRTMRRFLRHRLAVIGLVIIVILVVAAFLAPESLALKQNLAQANKPPSPEHWLGTDRNGRDVLARTLVGGRVSILVGLVAVLIAAAIGTVLGAISGYYRTADFAIMRVVDIVMSFPTIILLLVAVAVLGPGLINMMIMVGLITWTTPCRIVRGQFLQLREADYIQAAKVMGVRDRAIVIGHILPNSLAPLLVYASLGVASVVLLEAGLSYLGLGVQPPTPSWGNILNDARNVSVFERQAWQWAPAGILCVLFVLAVNFVGDGLRDAFDPRATTDR